MATALFVKELQQFLVLAINTMIVRHFAIIAAPLSDLKGKWVPFCWVAKRQNAFDEIWDALCNTNVSSMSDFQREFVVKKNAGNRKARAILE